MKWCARITAIKNSNKGNMRTIKLATARTIAADWHGGQWSALYAFASSGKLEAAQAPLCLTEIAENLGNKTILPGQAEKLEKLKRSISVRFLIFH
jgi:hypothetical protein